jgi:predicted Zn-ribbon and HTH transcriptional regulator
VIPPVKWLELVECPKCKSEEEATVTFPLGHPWPSYVHECKACGYYITESEWERSPK